MDQASAEMARLADEAEERWKQYLSAHTKVDGDDIRLVLDNREELSELRRLLEEKREAWQSYVRAIKSTPPVRS